MTAPKRAVRELIPRVLVALVLAVAVSVPRGDAANAETTCNEFCMTVGPDAVGALSLNLSWANVRSGSAIGYILVRSAPSGVTMQAVPAPGSYRDPAPEPQTCYLLLPVLLSSNPQSRSSFPLCYLPTHTGQLPLRLTVQTFGFCIGCPLEGDRVSAERTGVSGAITVLSLPIGGSPGTPGSWTIGPDASGLAPTLTSTSTCYYALTSEGARTAMVCSLYGTIAAARYTPPSP